VASAEIIPAAHVKPAFGRTTRHRPPVYAWAVSAIYAWLRRHPRLVDAVLALFLALAGVGGGIPGLGLRLPLCALMVVPVVFRRRNPLAAFGVATVSGAIQVLAGVGPLGSDLAILVLLYTVAAYRPRRESVAALIICIVGAVLAVNIWPVLAAQNRVDRLFVGAVAFGGLALTAWILGDSMRYRRAYYAALEDRAARLEAERDAQAKVAAAAERARIARELHDVIAHNVSVMVVQADGAGYVLRSDPDRAAAAIAAISRTGRQALTEMRRLLGLLRAGDEAATLAPVPGLAQLRELLDQARTAGLSVSFSLEGVPRPLPEGAELAAYRVVQESLTNTRKHGGLAAAAAVTLRYEADDLVVQVTDDGLGAAAVTDGAGHGLTGMRERIEVYGGTIQSGPLPTGGYQVMARLPCPQPMSGAA
jgi:signal transduction histidine kinase